MLAFVGLSGSWAAAGGATVPYFEAGVEITLPLLDAPTRQQIVATPPHVGCLFAGDAIIDAITPRRSVTGSTRSAGSGAGRSHDAGCGVGSPAVSSGGGTGVLVVTIDLSAMTGDTPPMGLVGSDEAGRGGCARLELLLVAELIFGWGRAVQSQACSGRAKARRVCETLDLGSAVPVHARHDFAAAKRPLGTPGHDLAGIHVEDLPDQPFG